MLVALPFLICGLLCIVGYYFLHKRGQASLQWPTTPGAILDSQVMRVKDANGNHNNEAYVLYGYQVAGTHYQCKKVSLVSIGDAYRTVQKYPTGAQVVVHYNPQKPSTALLEPGEAGVKVPLFLGIGLVVAALVMMVACPTTKSSTTSVLPGSTATTTVSYADATALYAKGDYAAAKTAFENLAASGNAEAKVYLGVMYVKGQGVPQDLVQSQKWFILAGGPGNSNRAEIAKSLTPAQEQQAESLAQNWKP